MYAKLLDWIPFVLIVAGIILGRLGIGNLGILVNVGLFCYGLFGVIDSVKKKYYANFSSLKFLKFAGQAAIAVLAIMSMLEPLSLFVFLILILMDRIILTPGRI